ncbi:hypothetical protein LSTR_LSTR005903 [Laodelphax striatellus]|uniref:Transmembrane protein 200A n=1 Tax=Laodelphax striatellus TaxID=195883 RepID=A0A482WR87_LAOST|nr:hypothetical protein LSTR_LSTR005903 [Laodelphax striatellus]
MAALQHGASTRCSGVPRNPAQWNVQVVKGKVNKRCFWNACKALSFGLLLMLIGASMATIGYYADQLSVEQEMRGNSTVHMKPDTRVLHLNNLSYAGPIVMGVGAACVMTFEARDSAAKIVPTRPKYSSLHPHRLPKPSPGASSKLHSSLRSDIGRRGTGPGGQGPAAAAVGAQTASVFRVGSGSPMATDAVSRRAMTAAFIQFSRTLQQAEIDRQTLGPQSNLSKSPSAPNLAENVKSQPALSPHLGKLYVSPKIKQKKNRNSLHPDGGGCALLNPHALLKRQALSMDNPDYSIYFPTPRLQQFPDNDNRKGSGESKDSLDLELGTNACTAHGSQASMAMDLHLPNDCPVTLRVKDRTRRSDTAKRHVFTRQQQVENAEEEIIDRRDTHSCSPRLPGSYYKGFDDIRPYYSRSTPHSRRESMTKNSHQALRANTTEEQPHPRSRSNTNESLPSRRSSGTRRRKRYSRSNTVDDRMRRGSNQSDSNRRESSHSLRVPNRRSQLQPQTSSTSGKSLPESYNCEQLDYTVNIGGSVSAEHTPFLLSPDDHYSRRSLPVAANNTSDASGSHTINISSDDHNSRRSLPVAANNTLDPNGSHTINIAECLSSAARSTEVVMDYEEKGELTVHWNRIQPNRSAVGLVKSAGCQFGRIRSSIGTVFVSPVPV